MNCKFQPGQTAFLAGGNVHLIKEATVVKYSCGLYTIRFTNGGGTRVRKSRLFPSLKKAEAAIQNRKK